MFNQRSDTAWEKYGKLDPYFGVINDGRFQGTNLDNSHRTEFFASGEEDMERFFETIRHHLDGEFAPVRALDFGCGVGRLTIPLARRCAQVVGVDVSEAMLEEARRNCEQHSISNVELVRSDDLLSKVTGTFDFVHSFIVFQHIPVRRGEAILRAMLKRLGEKGTGALHFTYARRASRARKLVHRLRKSVPGVNNVVNLVQGRVWTYPMMQMNDYNLGRLFSILQEMGCRHLYVRFTDHGGHQGVILFFQKTGLPVQ